MLDMCWAKASALIVYRRILQIAILTFSSPDCNGPDEPPISRPGTQSIQVFLSPALDDILSRPTILHVVEPLIRTYHWIRHRSAIAPIDFGDRI